MLPWGHLGVKSALDSSALYGGTTSASKEVFGKSLAGYLKVGGNIGENSAQRSNPQVPVAGDREVMFRPLEV